MPETDEEYARRLKEWEAERELRALHYLKAVVQLYNEDTRWRSNYNLYARWDTDQRIWWIDQIEAQAAKGVVMATELIARATLIRMTK